MNWTSCARINARRGLPPATMGAGGQNPAKNCRRPQSASNPSSVSGIPKRGMSVGKTPPVYAHLATVLDASGAKMSKRAGAMSLLQYRDEGYLPEAVLNYLARLGWSHG